jgi:1-acyl-sn-glycerol-3-phosphate acyltransferase
MDNFRLEVISACLAVSLGIVHLFRRPAHALPLPVRLIRRIADAYLSLFKSFRVFNADLIPASGPVIIVANHSAAYDPVCLQVGCGNRLIRFLEAREYYDKHGLQFLYRMLHVIPINRTGNDTAGIRMAARELRNHGCIGIFPEGRISDDCQLQQARQGVAFLALLTNAAVVPAYIHGTRPFSGMVRDFLQFNPVTLHFGPPIRFNDLAGQHHDKQSREIALHRTMNAIAKLKGTAEQSCAEWTSGLLQSDPNPWESSFPSAPQCFEKRSRKCDSSEAAQ